jgi:hypothetical protein
MFVYRFPADGFVCPWSGRQGLPRVPAFRNIPFGCCAVWKRQRSQVPHQICKQSDLDGQNRLANRHP